MLSLACGMISIYMNKNLDDETDIIIGSLASGLLIMGC